MLFKAIETNETASLREILSKIESVNVRDDDGDTPLTWAVQNGHIESVEKLISAGADPNMKDGIYGAGPLHWAVSEENEEIVELLIKRGAQINMVNNFGQTPLFMARGKNNAALIKLLKRHGAREL